MIPSPVSAWSFGPFRLDRQRFRLYRDGRHVPLGNRALDLLIALIERAGEVVSKKELIASVWPASVVDESNLRRQIAVLRHALGDPVEQAELVATVAGRGYRFIGSVAPQHPPTGLSYGGPPASAHMLAGRDMPPANRWRH